jgi:CHAT domain-containing protein
MNEILKNENSVREYLLGRIADENLLADYEELLFLDEEFCSLAEIVEDDLINDYVRGNLNEKDRADFEKTLENNKDRRAKVLLTKAVKEKAQSLKSVREEPKPSFFESIRAFFQNPLNIGIFTVLLVGMFALAWFVLSRQTTDEIAELRNIYKQERPTESRLSEFDYAPLIVTRGETEEREKNRLRRIENSLLDAVEKNPSAENRHALGVFYLTQRKFDDAIKELEKASKTEEKNAKILNDLGSAYFEFAKNGAKERKIENLAKANEKLTKAIDTNPDWLAAIFNKALILQELGLPQQAKETWQKYLEKDANSKWAEEARKNLEKINALESFFKSKEKIIEDFLFAYRNKDDPTILKIHNETKGYLKDISVPFLLSRRYLEAKQKQNENEARESLEALNFIGGYEKQKHADFFVAELAEFYRNLPSEKFEKLIEAKNTFDHGFRLIAEYKYADVIAEFEKSRDIFQDLGNDAESVAAEVWAVQFLPDIARMDESRRRLNTLNELAVRRQFKVLEPPVFYWLGVTDYRQNRFSDSLKNVKIALQKARETENLMEIEHCAESVTGTYSEIGEIEKSLSLAGEFLRPDAYLESKSQYWRNKSLLADLMFKFGFLETADDVSKEEVSVVENLYPKADLIDATLRRRGEILLEKKDFEMAWETIEKARQRAESREESEQNNITKAKTYLLRGDVQRLRHNCEAALVDYEYSLDLSAKIPEFTVIIYNVHKGKLLCLNALQRQSEFQTELETALKLSEEYRQKIREDESRQAFFGNEQIVFETAIENALANGEIEKAFGFAETSRARSLLEFVKSKKSIAETEKEFAEIAKPLTLKEIQVQMPETVQILEYAVLPKKTVIWRITKNKFEFTEKAISAEDLETKVKAYRNSILEKKTKNEIENASQELYKIVVPETVEKDKTLCIIPDKSLNSLPFVSLIGADKSYLIENFSLLHSRSATVFIAATENAKAKEKVTEETILSVGNPAFDRVENPSLADLPEAVVESQKIAKFYPKAIEFVGEKAVRERFLENLNNAEVVHFAGHFVVNPQSAANSKLIFADQNLHSSELVEIKLSRAKLVILSACETAFERFNKSEGAIGAARSFLAMGAPLVAAGNWKIDSEASKDLMILFHRNRREKSFSSAESLRQAQIEMLRRTENNQPYFWAAFDISGGFTDY